MKKKLNSDTGFDNYRHERVMITRAGKFVAMLIGLEGLDEEQLELGYSDKFWQLIEQRRKQRTMSRAELEKQLEAAN